MNANIKTFKALVGAEYLFNMDEKLIGQTEECIVFGITSYLNETLTFQIMLESGAMFSYIPFHAIRFKTNENSLDILELTDLVYHNCNNLEFEYHVFEHLKGDVYCYFKYKNIWMIGEYYATIDFYTGNDMLHIIKLKNGQVAALPTHKIQFKNFNNNFPQYKKLRKTWKV